MKILITGGAGFIGVNLTKYFAETHGYEVTSFDDFSLGKREFLDGMDVDIIEGSILDFDHLQQVSKGKDAIIHLAAHTRVIESIEKPEINFRINVDGTFNVLMAARKNKVNRVIFASTGGAILGEAKPPIHEDMCPTPIAPYGASKLAGEAYCSAFSGAYGIHTNMVRFSNVYGPHSYHKGSAVALFFRQILDRQDITVYGDGGQCRDFIYVEDLCEGIFRTIINGTPGRAYQIASGIPLTITELLEKVRKTCGPDFPFDVMYEDARAGEVNKTWCDISRAKHEIGFNPTMPISEGLKITWEWLKYYHDKTNKI